MAQHKSVVFNSKFNKLGVEKILGKKILLPSDEAALAKAQKEVTSEFCEELLLFDKVSLKADRINYSLYFLIQEFGISTIQEYFERGLIELFLWTPVIVTSTGMQRADGTIDKEAVIGKPPLVSGQLSDADSDPENNIDNILKNLNLPRNQLKGLKSAALNSIILPNNSLALQSVNLTLDAYKTGKLANLGLQNLKDPNELNVEERIKLMELSNDVLETSILAQYEYKSLDEYSYSAISKHSLESIGSALNVKEGATTILTLENIPDLRKLFLNGLLDKNDLKSLRYKSSAKAFRKWLNEVSMSQDCSEISKEYLNEITGRNNFWDSSKGKVVKNLGMLAIGSALAAAIGGLTIPSVIAGTLVTKGAELGLGLFDSFYLDGLLKGPNPRVFTEEVTKQLSR